MYKIPAKPVDFLRFLGYGDNFEKLRFVFENDALRLKMREHFVLRIIDEYIMEVAVPGLKKEWVRINVTNEGLLHLAIENKMEHKEESKECKCNKERHERYLRHEFYYGNYEQSYTLPDDVERDNISASVADGLLTIVIPKTTPEKEAKVMKNIEVK